MGIVVPWRSLGRARRRLSDQPQGIKEDPLRAGWTGGLDDHTPAGKEGSVSTSTRLSAGTQLHGFFVCGRLSNPNLEIWDPRLPHLFRPDPEQTCFLCFTLLPRRLWIICRVHSLASPPVPAQYHLYAPSRSPSVTNLEKNGCRSNLNPSHVLFTPHRPEPNTIGILDDLLCRPLPSPYKTMEKKSGSWKYEGLCYRSVSYKVAGIMWGRNYDRGNLESKI